MTPNTRKDYRRDAECRTSERAHICLIAVRRPAASYTSALATRSPRTRIVVVAASDSAPIKRLVQTARERSQVIDVTFGHRTRCVLVLDTGQVVLAALSARAIARRVGLSREDDGT